MGDLVDVLRRGLAPPTPEPSLPPGMPSAVVVPILGDPPALVFTRRTDDVRHHKGEVSFPGGARHPEDPDLLTTALRETEEELAIPPAAIEVVGRLPLQDAVVSGFVVLPFVGLLSSRPQIRPNPIEVAEVLELEVERLAEAERVERRQWQGATYDTFVYEIEGTIVRGLTGRILHELLETLRREGWT